MAKPKKRQNRSGVSLQLYVEQATRDALDLYVQRHKLKPSVTSVVELAIVEYLTREGAYPPKPDDDEEE